MVLRRAGPALALLLAACSGAGAPAAQPSPTPTPSPAASALASATASPSPRAAVSVQCGQRIASDFTLANDMTCDTDALVVVADGVTIDLNGRTIRGPGMGPQTWPAPQLDSVGVRVEGTARGGVTIKNGRITEFSTGVYLKGVGGSTIEGITSTRSRYGLYIHESAKNTIRGNTLEANIYGLHLQHSSDNLIQGNKLVRQTYNSPGGYGIYLFASDRNRITENDIEANVNWGIWLSEARGNVTVRNNVVGNRPNVSDNTEGNTWHDAERKEGNHWSDYRGADTNGDGIGDSGAYLILGPANVVDPYPFVARDGWKKRSGPTRDTYVAPAPRPPARTQLIALAGGRVLASDPDVRALRPLTLDGESVSASTIALGTDGRTLYALAGDRLTVAGTAGAERRAVAIPDAVLAANRDGRNVVLLGPRGGQQLDLESGASLYFGYVGEPQAIAASYKHNQLFVSTPDGIDLVYLGNLGHHGRGGQVAYTIPLGGAAGPMAMNGSGTRIYVGVQGRSELAVVDTEQFSAVRRIPLDGEITAVAVSPREDRVYVATGASLLALDPAGAVLARAAFLGSVADLAVSRDGSELYAALAGLEHAVAVLRTGDLARAHIIPLDDAPTRLLAAAQ